MDGLRPDLVDLDPPADERFASGLDVDFGRRVVDLVRYHRPITFAIDQDAAFTHPWELQPVWNGARERFEVSIHPGFVNAQEVTVRMDARDAPPEAVERTGQKTGPVDALLTEYPAIPIDVGMLRKIGTDAVGVDGRSMPVPEFFAERGVRPPPDIDTSGESLEIELDGVIGDGAGVPRRLLRSLDVVLTQSRRSVKTIVTTGPDGGDAVSVGVYTPPGIDDPPFVSLVAQFEPALSLSFAEMVLDGLADEPFDKLHLATLYFLSPDGTPDDSDPDVTWTVFPAHHVFWNLRHDTTEDLRPTLQFDRVPVVLPLAGGVGTPLAQFFADQATDAANDVLQMINRSRIRGKFWTL